MKIPQGDGDRTTSVTLRPGKHAVFTHKGSVSRIGETHDVIWEEWLPTSGKKIDMKALCLERYDERFRDDDNSVIEILCSLESYGRARVHAHLGSVSIYSFFIALDLSSCGINSIAYLRAVRGIIFLLLIT